MTITHEGIAINLFMLDIPRLSVDIDISYIDEVAREDMLEERLAIEAGIEAVARAQGYTLDQNEGDMPEGPSFSAIAVTGASTTSRSTAST